MYENNNNRYCKSQSRKQVFILRYSNDGFCLKQMIANVISILINNQNEVPRCLSVP